jgi:peptidoglycan-N-acetylglucosamine deacetylase
VFGATLVALVVLAFVLVGLHVPWKDSGLPASPSTTLPAATKRPPPDDPAGLPVSGSDRPVPKGKLVALTFDDGPSVYTDAVVRVLQREGVFATFFFIGQQVPRFRGEVARLREDGFEVENHSWTHRNLAKLSPAAIEQELTRTNAILGGATYLRPPYGSYNRSVLREAEAQGLRVVVWNVDTLDWRYRQASSIAQRAEQGAKPGSIILMHDGGGDRRQTVAALPHIIDWLRAHGYTPVTLATLVRADATLKSGHVLFSAPPTASESQPGE